MSTTPPPPPPQGMFQFSSLPSDFVLSGVVLAVPGSAEANLKLAESVMIKNRSIIPELLVFLYFS